MLSPVLKSVPAVAVSLALAGLSIRELPAIAQTNSAIINPISTTSSAFVPPPNRRRRPGNRTTTGTRQDSCVGDSDTAFTLLSPINTVGYSTAQQPTVSWYSPEAEASYPVKLRFFIPNQDGITEIEEVDLTYQAGITSYPLPVEAAALTPGVDYRWQVVVLCNENRPSQSLVQSAWFQIAEPTADAQQVIDQATTSGERALAYGQAGFWYDAIAQVAQASDPESVNIRHQLLQDLATYLVMVEPEESEAEDDALADAEALSDNILNIIQADAPSAL